VLKLSLKLLFVETLTNLASRTNPNDDDVLLVLDLCLDEKLRLGHLFVAIEDLSTFIG